MSNDDLKKALLNGAPVVCHGITYQRISAIIYRPFAGSIKVSVELLDRNGTSVTIAPASVVEFAEQEARP